MFCMAAQSLGYRVAVLDPGGDSPAGSVADRHLRAGYLDSAALSELASLCGAITTEFENVPAQSLAFLSRNAVVSPTAESVAIAQDRIAEKRFIGGCGIEVAPYAVIEAISDIDHAARVAPQLFPGVLKVSRFGYDGKGQARVADRDEAIAAFTQMGSAPCILEKRLLLAFELSVVVARDFSGATVIYPVAENIHRDGILAVSHVPSQSASPGIRQKATNAALTIARELNYAGVLCVEFFVLDDESIVVNEIAPRPHNSGHFSIDACATSQFEQQARILAGLPLGDARQHSPAIMLNLLGDLWFDPRGVDNKLPANDDNQRDSSPLKNIGDSSSVESVGGSSPSNGKEDSSPFKGEAGRGMGSHGSDNSSDHPREPDWAAVLAHPEAHLHLYAKRDARRRRKMGHVTITASSEYQAERTAREVAALLGIAPW